MPRRPFSGRARIPFRWLAQSPWTGKTLSFAAAVIGVSVTWLIVLPRYAQQPAMREHLRWLDEQRIDPSAMYYTELEVMESILARHRARELAEQRRSRQARKAVGDTERSSASR